MTVTRRTLQGLRPVRDADAAELIALIGAAYDEYEGCVLDLPGIDADLEAPATAAVASGGRWWVVDRLDRDGQPRVVASVGCGPVADGVAELKRLYVATEHRRQGLATALVVTVEGHAIADGATAVELWSDTRFHAAHRRYHALGYRETGETRHLHDPSDTTELRFVRALERGDGR